MGELRLEGVVAKRRGAQRRAGHDWVKIKHPHARDLTGAARRWAA